MKKSRKRVLSILLAVMMVLTMMPMTAMAGEGGITINGGTVTYNSIAEAVDAATDGQTINIPAGTYDVGNNFYIDKQVDLKGAGAAETIITGSIFLTQSKGNMTVSNLTMQGSGVHVALNFQGSSNG